MTLNLVIADHREALVRIWQQVFDSVDNVTVVCLDPQGVHMSYRVDAELMIHSLVHERYGGRPKAGQVQILSSRGDPGMAPWVVTTPPFPAHFEQRPAPDGEVEMIVVKDNDMSPEEETHYVFSRVFASIAAFQESGNTPEIRTLGVNLLLINAPFGDPISEAEAVLKAYKEFYG